MHAPDVRVRRELHGRVGLRGVRRRARARPLRAQVEAGLQPVRGYLLIMFCDICFFFLIGFSSRRLV